MQNQTGKTALLILDIQNGIVSQFNNTTTILSKISNLINAARQNHIFVIFVRVGFDKGYPEINPQNKFFSAIPALDRMTILDKETQIHESISPKANEPIITKYRFSAFSGSNLELILRSQQINTLILSGISTSGVVLSTVREAADKDFILKVISDACFDRDPEVHRILTEKIFPNQAEVLTSNDWIQSLNSTNDYKIEK